MDKIGKILALFLTATIMISCLPVLTVKPVNAQSTPIPEITILYPANGTFFNISRGVDSFQLKYTTNNPSLSWIGYSIDGGQNKTAYGEWYNIQQISYDAEGNPSVRVSGVFERDGNHNLTLFANNTVGDWASPQIVTYLVNINADTTSPPTTSTISPTDRNAPHLDPIYYLIPVSIVVAVVILSVLLLRRHRKTANLS